MPLARITLLKGRSPGYVRAIADAVHASLVSDFETPVDDRFQVVHQVGPDEFIYDRNYRGGPRTDAFVLVSIMAGRQRSTAVKDAFYGSLAKALAKDPGISPADVMVIISTTAGEDWSFSRGLSALAASGP